jgi:hypothetical protein
MHELLYNVVDLIMNALLDIYIAVRGVFITDRSGRAPGREFVV